MQNFTRRIAVVVGTAALSAGLLGATAPAAQARDSSWGWRTAVHHHATTAHKASHLHHTIARDSSWGW